MTKKKSFLSPFTNAYGVAASALSKDHRIYLPFLIFAVVELLSLVFMYLAPRMPLKAVMGPIITTFWGDRFLHYPQNFFLLPKLALLARTVLSIFLGSLLTGAAVAYLYKKQFMTAFRKYTDLLIIVFVLTATYYVVYKVMTLLMVHYFSAGHAKLLFGRADLWLGPIRDLLNQLLALVLQSLFAYAIPVLILTDKKFFGAIVASFKFSVRHAILTLFFVGLPMLIAVPLIILNYNGPLLMLTFFPEIIFWLGVLGIVVNSLLIDPMITLSTAAYYASERNVVKGQK